MLKTYQDFLSKINELGVFSFSGNFLDGFPKLQDETIDSQWHTGIPETDPWIWKDQVAIDHKAAFGNILGGNKGFISADMYPLFYAANRPQIAIKELYDAGKLSKAVLDIYNLFETTPVLSTADIRRMMIGDLSLGKSKMDGAIIQLQKQFYITVCGNQRKISKAGKEYGWPANTYCQVEDWAGDWLTVGDLPEPEDARAMILNHCSAWGKNLDMSKLEKLLF